MLDLSDGLALDARRIARASGVSLYLSSEQVREVALAHGLDPAASASLALTGGEDHSLLATFAADRHGPALLVDGRVFDERGGWDPFAEWSGQGG